MMKILILIFTFFLTACASIPKAQVEDRLQLWKASNMDELVKFWGLPVKQQQLGRNNVAEWENKLNEAGNSSVRIGGGSYGRHSSIGLGFIFSDLGGKKGYCKRQVSFDKNGKILSISWKGDGDYCYQITPDREAVLKNVKSKEND